MIVTPTRSRVCLTSSLRFSILLLALTATCEVTAQDWVGQSGSTRSTTSNTSDVASATSGQRPSIELSSYVGQDAPGYEQSVAYSECGPQTCPGLPPYCDDCLTRLSWNKNGYRITPFGSVNGLPNVEGRIAPGFGEDVTLPLVGPVKPIEFGVSGVIGETRTTATFPAQRVSDTWAAVADTRIMTERWGIQGEYFAGQAIGSYGGGIDQSLNLANGLPIYSSGGWGEVWYKLLPCLTTHVGYGIDNPTDSDLSASQRSRNEFYFGNLVWDVTKRFQLGFEVSHWKTDYIAPSVDNSSMVYHFKAELFY